MDCDILCTTPKNVGSFFYSFLNKMLLQFPIRTPKKARFHLKKTDRKRK